MRSIPSDPNEGLEGSSQEHGQGSALHGHRFLRQKPCRANSQSVLEGCWSYGRSARMRLPRVHWGELFLRIFTYFPVPTLSFVDI